MSMVKKAILLLAILALAIGAGGCSGKNEDVQRNINQMI